MGSSAHHVVDKKVLWRTLWALIVLTVLTVVTAKFMQLGPFAGAVAILIAGTKALLVMGYFMGLKYDSRLNRFIFLSGFGFLLIIAIFVAIDAGYRLQVPSP